jgi:hypothetical protein
MNPAEIVSLIKSKKPKLLENITDVQALGIVRAALTQINNQIEQTEDGLVVVQGLGRFRIKQVERKKEDQTVTVKRVIFKSEVKKAKKAK